MSKIIVFVEQNAGNVSRASLEALGAANSLGGEVVAVVFGDGSTSVALNARQNMRC